MRQASDFRWPKCKPPQQHRRLRRLTAAKTPTERPSTGSGRPRKGSGRPWRSCSGASATPVASTTRNATTPMSPASPTPSAISARASSSPTALESVSEFFSGPSSSSGGNHIRRFSISRLGDCVVWLVHLCLSRF